MKKKLLEKCLKVLKNNHTKWIIINKWRNKIEKIFTNLSKTLINSNMILSSKKWRSMKKETAFKVSNKILTNLGLTMLIILNKAITNSTKHNNQNRITFSSRANHSKHFNLRNKDLFSHKLSKQDHNNYTLISS